MIDFPGSKVNLGLRITQKLDNGYHSLESVFLPIQFSDVLEIIPTSDSETQFNYSGFEISGDSKNNLIYRAWQILNEDFSIPPSKIYLHKVVPMGAGIGGGSADGSSMLKLINEHFKLGITQNKLELYAKELGADCPFFIRNKSAYVEGIGEIMSPISLNLSGYHFFLVAPGIHINTGEAFKNCQPKQHETSLKEIIEKNSISSWKDLVKNDFEDYAFKSFPELRKIKEQMYKAGALYASMSGTGSSIYGFFEKENDLPSFPEHYITYHQKC